MRILLKTTLTVVVLLSIALSVAKAGDFPLQDNDIWVMAGDSITAQHLHSNYFEAFCFARYPKLKFAFRNSGVGGHTIPSTMARFDYDIAAWKPTVVSVELGMNDQGGTTPEKFIDNMGKMVERIRAIKARPVIFSPSPINNGDTMAKLAGNKRLSEYSFLLKDFCAKEKIPYADQFHALVDIWGKNKPRESLADALEALKANAQDHSIAGVEHLRAFLAAQQKNPASAVSMRGDAVHPGAPGQLMMAAALLKALDADGFVSSVTLDAGGKLVDSKGCNVSDVKAAEGAIAFDRLDECLPFPIPEDARAVLALFPGILELSQYSLKVTGLKEGAYVIKIDGIAAATVSEKDLAAGVNLTAFGAEPKSQQVSPIVKQSKAILDAVAAKEGLVGQWRGVSQRVFSKDKTPKLEESLEALTKKVEEADAKIRETAKPKKMHFEISAAK